MEDLDRAVEYVEKFLNICKSDSGGGKMEKKKKLTGKAHKKLAELHSKLGNGSAAIRNLEALLNIAFEDNNKQGQAEAALKLGLLNFKEGLIPTSVNYLQKHFDLARHMGNENLIDAARVNLGIAQASTSIDKYLKLVLTDVHALIDWKRDQKF